jgi:hypothetical protein
LDSGRNADEVLQGSRKFKVETYIPLIDSLVNNLEKRSKEYEEIFEKFGFLDQCEITIKEGGKTQPKVDGWCRERPQTPWYTRVENKGAVQEPTEEDHGGVQDPHRVVVSAKKK